MVWCNCTVIYRQTAQSVTVLYSLVCLVHDLEHEDEVFDELNCEMSKYKICFFLICINMYINQQILEKKEE